MQYHGTVYDVEALETLRGEQTVPKQKKQSPKTTTVPAEITSPEILLLQFLFLMRSQIEKS